MTLLVDVNIRTLKMFGISEVFWLLGTAQKAVLCDFLEILKCILLNFNQISKCFLCIYFHKHTPFQMCAENIGSLCANDNWTNSLETNHNFYNSGNIFVRFWTIQLRISRKSERSFIWRCRSILYELLFCRYIFVFRKYFQTRSMYYLFLVTVICVVSDCASNV